ncbi:hypothetical protein [Sphingomonas nostoxanthinifaciens]|uniref:hypothetical protein n=1 Tax=Sphingomonas nostoxanthinifaciens TaxID=2872652 RepID=UPI001CC21FB7|nr:hypothetical protein [Sphingomonas nostoxanthinifaciens]UAK24580.1 hypothetical protein K8P63_20155 [Sphingomonas nostoxanthinifaciens]
MIRAVALGLAVLAAPVMAATPDAALQKLLAGKHAEAPRRCIMPDLTAQPRIIDGRAMVYWRGRTTYDGSFKGGCSQLRADRTVITTMNNGQLCANDPARVVQAGASSGFGFCTFDGFTPYRK